MEETSLCDECGGVMVKEGNMMKCEDCGYSVASYDTGGEEGGDEDMG